MTELPKNFTDKPWGTKAWKAYIPKESEYDWYTLLSNTANAQRLEQENQKLLAELEAAIERKEEVHREAGRQLATEKRIAELASELARNVIERQRTEIEELRANLENHPITQSPNDSMLTLATLCDMVLGEDAADRSDAALLAAVRHLLTRREQAARQDETITALSQRCVEMENNLAAIRNALAFIIPQENESTLEIVKRLVELYHAQVAYVYLISKHFLLSSDFSRMQFVSKG